MDQQTLDLIYELSDLVLEWGVSVVGALLILIVGWILAGWAKRKALRGMDRTGRIDPTLKPILANIVRYAILILVLVTVLAQFGVQTTSIIAILGAAGLAVGLSLQGTLSNIAAGLMMLFLRPFKVGDFIDADGISGTVDEIGLFTCQLRTADGIYLAVPNAQIWNRSIRNFSRLPTRRVDVVVGISYDDDIDAALKTGAELMAADPRVLDEPAPQTMVMALGDSAVDINLRCWTKTSDYWALLFDLTKNAKQGFEAAGLSIPYPQRDIHIVSRDASKAAKA
jgi:small conductance mechanosensitive channel